MQRKYVFYIDSMQLGGANRVMANLVNHFSSMGAGVILINDIAPDKDVPEYEIMDSVKRIFLDIHEKSSVLSNIKRIFKLRKIIKAEHIDTVVSFMGPPNIRMLLATMGLKCRKIVSVRNDPYKEYGDGLVKKVTNIIFGLADGCVFQTKDAAEYFSERIQRKSKIIFNPVGKQFYGVKRVDNPQNIVTVGRLFPQKNHVLLIKAFSKLAHEFPDENLIIYGEGDLRSELEDLVRHLGLENRVLLPGSISSIPEKLAEAKIFVLSSDYEGMPNALMEAMAVGVPVISTDCPCGGPKILVRNGIDGLLVPCDNVEYLANVLCQKLDDKNRENMGISAKQRAEIFREDKIYRQWEIFISSGIVDVEGIE